MVHRNAPLSETGRERLARCIVEDGWPLRRAAERFQVSPTTAKRWADRWRQAGQAGMADRSSRPRTSPRRTPTRTERRIVKVRVLRRWGPARIAGASPWPARRWEACRPYAACTGSPTICVSGWPTSSPSPALVAGQLLDEEGHFMSEFEEFIAPASSVLVFDQLHLDEAFADPLIVAAVVAAVIDRLTDN